MYKQLLQLFDKNGKRELIALFVVIFCMAIVETLGVASIMPFMALLSEPDLVNKNQWFADIYSLVGFTSIVAFQFFIGVIVLLVIVFANAFGAYTTWRIQGFIAHENQRIASRMLENYLYRPYAFFLNRNTSELGKNILSESAMLTEGIILPLIQMIAKALIILFILALLLWTDPALVLVMGGMSGIGYGLVYLFSHSKLGAYGQKRLDLNGVRYKTAGEALEGIKDIKILGKEAFFLDRFSKATKEFSNITANYQLIKALPRHLLEVIAFGGIMAITLYLLLAKNDMSKIIPVLSLYALAGYRLLPALQQIYLSMVTIKYNRATAELIHMEMQGNVDLYQESNIPASDINFNQSIDLNRIRFGYDGETSLFKDVSLSIKKNTSVAFVGETGSGKSTLADLIMTLHFAQQGELAVDGTVIDSENARNWRNNVGYVPQQIYLLDDTVASNIALGNEASEINLSRLESVARAAQIHDFIVNELSDGYQTIVGERGVRLSGGQRQRIGIARALYHDPDVIVFDEATSALDGITEQAVMSAITELSGKKTMIIIAHRLGTVKECDVIYVLEKGEVVDQGSYEDLINHNIHFLSMSGQSESN